MTRGRSAFVQSALVLAIVVLVWAPFLASKHVDDKSMDWTFRTDYVGYQLHALFHNHEFPFWVTLPRFEQLRVKGVHDFFANPETDVVSILTPLSELFSLLTAVKIALIVYLALGVWGCRRLLRLLAGNVTFVPLMLASLLALCNGGIVAHVLHGHIQFLPILTFPLSLALLLESWDVALTPKKRYLRACLGGAMLAGSYYSGATHPIIYFLTCFVGILPTVTLVMAPTRWKEIVPGTALVGLSFGVLAAFKFLPGFVDFGNYHADYFLAYDGFTTFIENLVIPWVPIPGHQLQHETNLYVGWVGVVILSAAALGAFRRDSLALLLVCASSAWLMFLKPESAWLKLPILRTQGVPTRLRMILIMVVAVVAASQLQRGLDRLKRRASRKRWNWLRVIVAGVSAFFVFDLSGTNVARHEAIGCEEQPSAMTGPFDAAPEIRPEDARAVVVHVDSLGTNEFTYGFANETGAPQRLLAPGLAMSRERPHLALSGDGELTTLNGELAVLVKARRGTFTLRFSDSVTTAGLTISLVGLVALLLLAVLAYRTPYRGVRGARGRG